MAGSLTGLLSRMRVPKDLFLHLDPEELDALFVISIFTTSFCTVDPETMSNSGTQNPIGNPSNFTTIQELPDDAKFNGENYVSWKESMEMRGKLKGLHLYWEGQVTEPKDLTVPEDKLQPTPVSSRKPNYLEYEIRESVAYLTIWDNVKNPDSLGYSGGKKSNELWKFLADEYTLEHMRLMGGSGGGGSIQGLDKTKALQAQVLELTEKVNALQTSRKGSGPANPDLLCSNPKCKRRGHTIENCFREGGGKQGQYPAWWKGKKDVPVPSANNTTASTCDDSPTILALSTTVQRTTTIPLPHDPIRIIADSGATHHFFRQKSSFITYSLHADKGGSSHENAEFDIVGRGDVKVEVMYGGVTYHLLFRDAFHAPNVSNNLMSTGTLDRLGWTAALGKGRMVFKQPNGKETFEAVLDGGVYVMDAKLIKPNTALAAQLPADIRYLHRASGHIMPERIEMAYDLVDGIPKVKGTWKVMGTCEDCRKAHTDKQAHPDSTETITEANFRWYLDIWGPAQVVSVGGHLYALFGTDAGTSRDMVDFLKDRTAATLIEKLEIRRATAETQTGKPLKSIRTDNAPEWRSQAFQSDGHWVSALEGENEDVLFLEPTPKPDSPIVAQTPINSDPKTPNPTSLTPLTPLTPTPATDSEQPIPNSPQQKRNRRTQAEIWGTVPTRSSTRSRNLTQDFIQSKEYEERESEAQDRGEEWAKDNDNTIELLPEFDEEDNPTAFTANLEPVIEPENTWVPNSYAEAMKRPDLWMKPMEKELMKLDSRKAFTPVPRPKDAKVITTRWVYALRLDGNGKITERRARLVVRGYDQVKGVHYDDTWAIVARYESERFAIAIAAYEGLDLWSGDFTGAYLNAKPQGVNYLTLPDGFQDRYSLRDGNETVLLMNINIYGSMDAGNNWFKLLDKRYREMGFKSNPADPCTYTSR
ncbi:hypothetical protein D9758_017295 [Tetrapyrgos nigripes]|uniref:Reverse transcriptase Ty1/copia-type domain-containing protein n=1 Tax=Tetrapyrgos nigripes TaxID=182062 RepID=A0A8H5FDZ4_9AGAR|nr:hypothetical protein D9758_017295 [Tetrapyrgos nigripes]